MSDSLFMPLTQRPAGRRELVGWEAVWMPLGEGEAEGLASGIGAGWKPIEVPRQLAATEGRQSIWYRTEFPRPDHAGRIVLRVGGAFLATNVWLNGKLLGSHYGHLAPFGFDLPPPPLPQPREPAGDLLRVAPRAATREEAAHHGSVQRRRSEALSGVRLRKPARFLQARSAARIVAAGRAAVRGP